MIICCPECQARYRIDPSRSEASSAWVKCPSCAHRFEISLLQDSSEPPVGEASSESLSNQLLIVDDARFFREMIKDILKDLPLELIEAADGREAWEIITSQKPRLVLLDMNIPEISGKEILHKLSGAPECNGIKVLAMSGVMRGDDAAHEIRGYGADDFINKSFKPSQLLSRVRQILDL